ncbi:MAG TPA: S53 family peptidase [Bryobacteraceae bacterium]|nr:S53 family peptidase [Bryobacteraceae bacterium]
MTKALPLSCGLAVLTLALSAATPAAIDRGPLTARAAARPVSFTIALKLSNLGDAEKLNEAIYNPGAAEFHQFLTADDFARRFAPSDADVARVTSALAKYGLKAERTTATTLKVTGLPSSVERAFQVNLHSFEVAARGKAAGYTYHAPTGRSIVPSEIADAVTAVIGLSNKPAMQPQFRVAPSNIHAAQTATAAKASTINPPGLLTVSDFASYYDVNPLYKKGFTGAGRTIGIMTFAAFTPSDAFAYWNAVGLTVNPNRISIVNVDGGPGAPDDNTGSIETTLDVEQSGGVAPGAKIIVYQAPNFHADVVDVIAKAVQDNKADSLSMSWGLWEWLFNLDNDPISDPFSGKTVAASQAVHELLLRASLQGQTMIAASGDAGAYEANKDFACFGPYSPSVDGSCSLALTTIFPAGDTLMTAAGGTTLPGTQGFCLTADCTGAGLFTVNVPHERVWGWDYLLPLCNAIGVPDPIACGIFPTGGGGGVSVMSTIPFYQLTVFGTQRSQPGQEFSLQPYGLLDTLPAFYPGRNLPDISANADPDTGYLVFYTSSVSGFGVQSFYGGTSFVAPQLNGVAALLGQELKGRVGLLNASLYGAGIFGLGYFGPNAPLHAITTGDNWFYKGSFSYNPGAGLGTLDVANFAKAMKGLFH